MAVYTQLTNEQIAQLMMDAYGLSPLAFALGIAQGVENTNYLVAIGEPGVAETKYILTIYEKRVAAGDLPFFLGLMQHAARAGIACPAPIARVNGTLYGEAFGKQAALVSFLPGKSRTEIALPHAAGVGALLASFHGATAGYTLGRANALSLAGWQSLYAKIEGRLDTIQPGLEALVVDELAYLAQHWAAVGTLPKGVIHADLFPDNVFFAGDDVSGMIDFYFACNDALAYDVAITLNAWCFDAAHRFDAEKSAALLDAYQQSRRFSDAERTLFPLLLRGTALRFLLTRAHDLLHHESGALVTPHDPMEYAAKLVFHRDGKDSGIYGL
jgi:homoserine kinase type II